MFHDCLVHDFDMSCWVLGELPIRVQAHATALIPEVKAIDDFDTIAFLLSFPSGAVAIGDNSRYSAYGYDQRLEAFGNKGKYLVDTIPLSFCSMTSERVVIMTLNGRYDQGREREAVPLN